MVSSPFRWTSASRSHPGRVREVNEDAFLELPGRGIWAVADGMGGHSLGEFASRLAIHSLADLPLSPDLEPSIALAQERLQAANHRLRAEAARHDIPLIGTTIATRLVARRECACLWAGDSRIYLYRNGRLRQLTRDHSEVEAARARGARKAGHTLQLPPANVITRALGAEDRVEIDCVRAGVLDGDIFLLCSDGLSNEVAEAAVEHALLPGNCRQAAQHLLDLALEHGGRDNITAVVVRAEDPCSPYRTVLHPVL